MGQEALKRLVEPDTEERLSVRVQLDRGVAARAASDPQAEPCCRYRTRAGDEHWLPCDRPLHQLVELPDGRTIWYSVECSGLPGADCVVRPFLLPWARR